MKKAKTKLAALVATVMALGCLVGFAACGTSVSYEDVAGTYTGYKVIASDAQGDATLVLTSEGTYELTEELTFGTFGDTGTYEIVDETTVTLSDGDELPSYFPSQTVYIDTETMTFEYAS